MPLTVQEGALLGAGMWASALSFYYFRKRQTLPFKAAYFAAWPTLGTAAILIGMPSRERMETALKRGGIETDDSLEANRRRTQLQLDTLRGIAEKHGKE